MRFGIRTCDIFGAKLLGGRYGVPFDFHDLDNRWRAGKVLSKKWDRSVDDKGYKSSFPEAAGPFGSLENEVDFKDVISHQRLGKNCAGAVQGSEVLSVVIRPFNQLKITILEAQDITDLGSLKEAARIFVPSKQCHPNIFILK
ncbi:hypothetical protein QJS10_CPA05g01191 [Acorus calamus]|uniref:Uncharacterized protein n=1 Tax=Acorus calamus TaxID=4465 RepID=A0AAV9EV67_ACOCL|nr:hypothetical protein QJS10_CPA05g01191 [Acorus calamus]